ncbi:sensor domain-containing protein [Aquibacillus saliphilus]|uniref:sensor domain-containing protein n=1 Tax=Aquibacillus saliphilus TaxID=1909422 RepID=UPI001CEFD276|nr:bifunctional diguanylate cyclase/phosphodiesterase [Aquibacillus saliphilus]
MNYVGRISTTVSTLIISIWLLELAYTEASLTYFYTGLFIAIVAIGISWTFGGQYDKAKFYYKQSLNNKEDLQQIFDSVDATIWSNDLINQKIYVSKGIEKMVGYAVEQFFDDYSLWLKIIHPDDTQKGNDFYKRILSGDSDSVELRFVNKKGELFWVQMSGNPIFGKDYKEVVKLNGVVVDISKRKKAELMLQESESRYRNVVEVSPNMIFIYQHDEFVYVNPATTKLLGLNVSELMGKSAFEFIHSSSLEKVIRRNREIYENENATEDTEYTGDTAYKIVRPDGESIYLEMTGRKIIHDGEPAILVVASDVTAKKEYQKKINYMAYHDALTGLPNRHMYNENLKRAMARSSKNNQQLAVMLIDLDRFKFINDLMGHAAGDDLLKQVAARLLASVRKGDLVSRQGGDEFAVLLEDIDELIVREISDRIIETFSTSFLIENKEFHTSPSIGISLFPIDGQDIETMNSKADMAMYLAKKRGKNNYQFFSHEGDILDRKIKLEHDILHGIKNNQFYLEYQPKLELKTERIYAVEALVRWKHPELGIISPTEFIPIVEESGLIVSLGKWILNEACKQNKRWQESGIQIKVAVNISAIQFEDRDFVQIVNQALSKYQLSPEYLGLEITESVMQNINQSSVIIDELNLLGVKISIDDFGIGYSSLSVLSKLPIDFVKIDKSFVNDIISNANTASLVKTMLEMGESLRFELIAEGIEEKQQADFLINIGCQFGQGYYYSPPLPPNELEKLVNNNRL